VCPGSDDLDCRGLAEITSKPGFLDQHRRTVLRSRLKETAITSFPSASAAPIDNPVFFKGTGDEGVNAVPNLRETKTTPGHQTP